MDYSNPSEFVANGCMIFFNQHDYDCRPSFLMCERCHYLAFEIHLGASYLVRSGAINFVETMPEGVKSGLTFRKSSRFIENINLN